MLSINSKVKNYRFFVSGRVQGVYYRANVAKNAKKAGFSGYVKNLDDGRVEACVTCEVSKLEAFKKILQKGSPISRVDSLEEDVCLETFVGPFSVQK